jgi:hypothetical protein
MGQCTQFGCNLRLLLHESPMEDPSPSPRTPKKYAAHHVTRLLWHIKTSSKALLLSARHSRAWTHTTNAHSAASGKGVLIVSE